MTDKARRERTPFSANRKRLEVTNKEKGYVYRWFNDQDDRISRAQEAGYEFVKKGATAVGDKEVGRGNTDINSATSTVVGRTAQSQPIRAFLMRIPEAWYQEDQDKKEATNRMVDDAIRAGKAGGASINNQYGEVDLQRKQLPA
jgi:hypothetical protein